MESKQVAQEFLKLASALVEAGGGVVPLKITKIGPKLWWFPHRRSIPYGSHCGYGQVV